MSTHGAAHCVMGAHGTRFPSMKPSAKTGPPRQKPLLAAQLTMLFVIALMVRIVGINWGLPSPSRWSPYHPDEWQTFTSVAQLDFFNGDFNPNFFNYPSLYLYLAYIAHTLAAGLGWTQPISNANAVWALPHDIILCARVVSAILGALTVPLVFLAAREIASLRVASLAAILMAFAPGHVQHSHFATVDVPATFFVALSLWLATRALRLRPAHEYSCGGAREYKRPRAWLLWSAFAAGLAAATKYNAVLVWGAPLVAAWLLTRNTANATNANVEQPGIEGTRKSNAKINEKKAAKNEAAANLKRGELASTRDLSTRDSSTAARSANAAATSTATRPRLAMLLMRLFVAAIGGFLVGCPFSVLNFGEFWGDGLRGGVNGFAYELLVHPRGGSGEIFQHSGNGWLSHLAFNLPFALSAPITILSVLGLAAWLKNRFASARARFVHGSNSAAAKSDTNFANASDTTKNDDAARDDARAAWPCAAFTLLYFFALGFSQVRFLRYTLPLLPALCVFAALGARFLAHQATALSPHRMVKTNESIANVASAILGAASGVLVVIATLDVLWPLTHDDPRDQAAAYIRAQAGSATPIAVGLADEAHPLWFFTPPLWPQSAPPGSAISTAQALATAPRYKLVFAGLDAKRLQAAKPLWFLINEFQWRDKERLRDADYALFSGALNRDYEAHSFRNRSPFTLPGRIAPYDFLYTNPEQRIYKRRN